jgi:Nucleotidyl transferase AbiEii toxin, Type IV TA system
MDTFAKLAAADQKIYFDETASRRNSTSTAIEKDFWVCWCLKRLFELQDVPELRFKGGTSLSKVFGLIQRFSEDIDISLSRAALWIPDSKTPNGVAEVPLTPLVLEAFRDQMRLSPCSPYLFPSDRNPSGHLRTLKTSWEATLRRAQVPYFRIYDLRSTYATRLSAGGVADEWVTQMLRQGDAQVFKKVFADETADEARSSGEAQPPHE